MDIEKLLKLLKIDKLDESDQSLLKEQIETFVEAEVVKRVDEKTDEYDRILEEAKENERMALLEEYENKFEEYKEEITMKFSNFVDDILEEEINVPDEVLEYAKQGKLYGELIEQMKLRLAIDEGVLDDEIKELLEDAKREILEQKEKLNTLIQEKLDLELKTQRLEVEKYINERCEGLTPKQCKHIKTVLEGETDIDVVDRKLDILIESSSTTTDNDNEYGKGLVDNTNSLNEDENPLRMRMRQYVEKLNR